MITRNSRIIVLFLLLLSTLIQAQSDPFVWQPEIDVNYQLNPDWNFNMGMSYRSQVDFELRGFDGEISSSHIQWDAKANYRTGFRSHIGMTSMYRINQIADRQAENEFRLSEAYALDISFGKFSLGNRLQADQRFRFSTTLFRFRYQLSLDFPLSGERLDPGEFYTIVSTESLLTTASVIRPLWDQRFTGALGYELNKQWKLQLNFEFRAEGYNRGLIQRYFLYTRVIYAIPNG